MKQYQLGPNGGIVTSLNLFATKFDQVLKLVGSKKNEFVIIDTPGQIALLEETLPPGNFSRDFFDYQLIK